MSRSNFVFEPPVSHVEWVHRLEVVPWSNLLLLLLLMWHQNPSACAEFPILKLTATAQINHGGQVQGRAKLSKS